MGHETGDAIQLKASFFKVSLFFLAHVWCWHFAVATSLGMILGALETLAQGLFNKPKYIRNGLWSSEQLLLTQYHKVTVFSKAKKHQNRQNA